MRRLLASSLSMLLAGIALADTRVPLEDFAQLPEFSDFKISPDGRYLAVRMPFEGRQAVILRDIFGRQRPGVVPASEHVISDFQWVSDDRLVVSVQASEKMRHRTYSFQRLVSIDKSASDFTALRMTPNGWGYFRQYPSIVSRLKGDEEHVLAMLNDGEHCFNCPEVHRVNLITGTADRVQRNAKEIFTWFADSHGRLRLGLAYEKTQYGYRARKSAVRYRADEGEAWETLWEADILDPARWVPLGFHPDKTDQVLVTSDSFGYRQGPGSDPVVKIFDLQTRSLVGTYEDLEEAAILARARQEFEPLRVEVISRDDSNLVSTIRVFGDQYPPEYYLYRRKHDKFDYLGGEYPSLKQVDLRPMQTVEYTARDGLAIPAYLTLPEPAGQQKPPLVVYPHGGPWSRDYWGFDNYVQFFANRGYAVFQPQFRGSTGFGYAHEAAGYGEWGYAIQDDITDGVNWLIAQGLVDPQRICIYGASFGGYAAAMGGVKTPDLYRCVISENAVLDLEEYIRSGRDLLFRDSNRAMWNEASRIKDASPLEKYTDMRAPILIIAGENDSVVPYKKHSRALYRKLKRSNHDVEYLLQENGEHWRIDQRLEVEKFRAIESFLEKHLAPSK